MASALQKLSWLISHPGFRKRPFHVTSRVLSWAGHRKGGEVAVLPLYHLQLKARAQDGIGRLICYFGDEADELFIFMGRYLKPGMTMVDVGANIGSHTLMGAAHVTDTGKVLAFEADAQTYALLQENIATNDGRNVEAYQKCLSDRPGQVTFNVNRDSAKSSIVRTGVTTISMTADTLENALPQGIHIDLLKIDVEGADYSALRGARGILERNPPAVVVIETTTDASAIHQLLAQYGYACYEYDGARSLLKLSRPVLNTYAIHASVRDAMNGFIVPPLEAAVAGEDPETH